LPLLSSAFPAPSEALPKTSTPTITPTIYAYYHTYKGTDGDVEHHRLQLLALCNGALAVKDVLGKPHITQEYEGPVKTALEGCKTAMERLQRELERIMPVTSTQGFKKRLKAEGQKLSYPFKKEAVKGLLEDVMVYQGAVDRALQVLGIHLNVDSGDKLTTLDEHLMQTSANVTDMDSRLTEGFNDLANHLRDCHIHYADTRAHSTRQIDETQAYVAQRFDEQADEVKKITSRIHTAADREKAERIISSLDYPERMQRETQIPEAHQKTLEPHCDRCRRGLSE
jgi:hypothetical protein